MPVYRSYSGELLAKLDDYQTKGRKEALANRPPSDSLRPDHHEAALLADAEKWLSIEQRLFDGVLVETTQALVDVRQKSIELKNNVDQLLSDSSLLSSIDGDMEEERKKLVTVTKTRMLAEVDWRFFREENKISAQPVYPESHVMHFAIIVALAFVETIINAFFYENAEGLLGGAIVALGVAVVNMITAVALGFGFRYKNLPKIDSKIFGWTCLFIFLVLTVFCNSLFAAFRSEYQLLSDPTNATQVSHGFILAFSEAKKIFFLDMQISDMSSFILFGLGLALSGMAFFKGYMFDDKYPGYGALDRVLLITKHAENERQDLLLQKIKDFLHHRRAFVQSASGEPAKLIGLVTRRAADLEKSQLLLNNQVDTIQRHFATVLESYRNANIAVRAGDPPTYFKDIPNPSSKVSRADSIEYLEKMKHLQDEIRIFYEKNQDALNAKLQSLQSESASILKITFSEFLKEVEIEAKEQIERSVAVIHRKGMESVSA
jgi:hypothetical protein